MKHLAVVLLIVALPLFAAGVQSPREAAELVMAEYLADGAADKAVYSFPRVLSAGETVDGWHEEVAVPFDGYLVLIDDMARANWEHPCRWVFVSLDGSTDVVRMFTPPMALSRMNVEFSDVEITEPGQGEEARNEFLDWFEANPQPVTNPENCYAWLVSGGANSGNNHIRYYGDTQFLYNVLVYDYGYLDENIIVCFADGTDPAPDNSDGENSNPDLDDDGDTDFNYDATYAGVENGYNDIKAMVGPDDYLLIMTTDHGGNGKNHDDPLVPPEVYLNLWNSETLDDDTFDGWIDDIEAANLNVIMEQCYSGGFLEEVIPTTGGQPRTFASAANGYESSWAGATYPEYDEWIYWWTGAMHGAAPPGGSYPGGDVPEDPDTNSDGYVSYGEAQHWAEEWDSYAQSGQEHPQYDDDPDSCGDDYWLGGEITEGIAGEFSLPVIPASGLSVTPNPVVTTASASFRLNAGAAVSLSVYDVSGRRVASMAEGDLEQGSHSFLWDAASEPSGVYLMVLRAGDSVATAKVVRASL